MKIKRYTGPMGNDGYMTITHNAGLISYLPFVCIGTNNEALIIYNVRNITNNSFDVGVMRSNNYVLSQIPSGTNVEGVNFSVSMGKFLL